MCKLGVYLLGCTACAWCHIFFTNPLKQDYRTSLHTVCPKKYAHGFCFAVLCCGYTLTDFPISIRLTSLALWQSNDCPSASKATLMNMDKYFMWIHYERLHNHNKAKHNKPVCIFLGIYYIYPMNLPWLQQVREWNSQERVINERIHKWDKALHRSKIYSAFHILLP